MYTATARFVGGPADGEIHIVRADDDDVPAVMIEVAEFRKEADPPYRTVTYLRRYDISEDGAWEYLYVPPKEDSSWSI